MSPKTTSERNGNDFNSSQHSRSLSEISVGEIILKYKDDSQLLNHILVAKAQEDKRRTAEELRQVEEARLQTKYIEYELSNRQDNYAQNDNHGASNSLFTQSFLDQCGNGTSLQAGLETSSSLTNTEFHYNLTTENKSASSLSPSIDFLSPPIDFSSSSFDLYSDSMVLSSSPPPSEDLLLFSSPSEDSVLVPPKLKKGKRSPKNMHRTLSYESVMNLNDMSIRPPSTSPPPQQPLDHDKVMEALRAKLRKSSSPYPSRPKPSPEPVPIPNTFPTTGILLLNLKNRRRKSSVTKRSNSLTKS